jgi:hypothetical protein
MGVCSGLLLHLLGKGGGGGGLIRGWAGAVDKLGCGGGGGLMLGWGGVVEETILPGRRGLSHPPPSPHSPSHAPLPLTSFPSRPPPPPTPCSPSLPHTPSNPPGTPRLHAPHAPRPTPRPRPTPPARTAARAAAPAPPGRLVERGDGQAGRGAAREARPGRVNLAGGAPRGPAPALVVEGARAGQHETRGYRRAGGGGGGGCVAGGGGADTAQLAGEAGWVEGEADQLLHGDVAREEGAQGRHAAGFGAGAGGGGGGADAAEDGVAAGEFLDGAEPAHSAAEAGRAGHRGGAFGGGRRRRWRGTETDGHADF